MTDLKIIIQPSPASKKTGEQWKWSNGPQGQGTESVTLSRVWGAHRQHARWTMTYSTCIDGHNYVIDGHPQGVLRVMDMDGIRLFDRSMEEMKVSQIITEWRRELLVEMANTEKA
jgi:hypothetical protein